jgi:hypothetical protein
VTELEPTRLPYAEIHPTMRAALGTFGVLRQFGFESADIFFHQNADEQEGPEPRGMMFVVLKTQGKTFSIRVGIVDVPYAEWLRVWKDVATAALDRRIEEIDRIVEESEAFRNKVRLIITIQSKGIRVPAANRSLS